MKRYGLPYKGSKNKIAQKIIQNIPASTHFYDLFSGGGAITHCALLSGKFKHVHYNDLSEIVYRYVYDCIFNDMSVDKKSSWISRENFIIMCIMEILNCFLMIMQGCLNKI